ncbi:MAG: exodeoxyribonuclease VII small subunit [Clostridia bacterium]|nr:exodeoxyribonuclease VII small subunit [Clostridia bacterium]
MKEEMKKFEEALQELEGLVAKLEKDIPLDEATKAFEDGIKLSKICLDDLNAEKGKLEELVDDLNNITEKIEIQ